MNATDTRVHRESSSRSYRLIAVLFSVFLALAVIILLVFESERATQGVYSEAARKGQFIFSTLSRQVSDALYFDDIEQVRKAAEIVESQNAVSRIAVFSDKGRFLFDSAQTMVPKGSISQALLDLSRRNETFAYRLGPGAIEFVGAIRFDHRTLGGLYFELDLTEQLAIVRSSLLDLAYMALVVVILLSALGFVLAGFLGTSRSLRVMESKFTELIEQSPQPYSMFHSHGDLAYANPAMQALLGALPQGYNILQDERFEQAGVALTLAEGFSEGPAELEPFGFRIHETQDMVWLKGVVFPLRNEDSRVAEVVVALEDVSAQIRAEERQTAMNAQLVQSQKLEALGVMARGIAHDFNNLLTPVMVSAELLTREAPGDTFDRYIKNIISGAQRASDLCQQLLVYGGSEEKALVRTDISSELEEMQALMSSSVSKNVVFRQSVEADLPLVTVDHSQVRQIILNLLINASEAVEEKGAGVVTLSTGVRTLSGDDLSRLLPSPDLPPGEYVFMEVEDTGSGMDSETQLSMFNPFFSTKFTGRGLGMSVVLGIVGDHGGGIAVQSTASEGTTITIYFPPSDIQQKGLQPEEPRYAVASVGGTLLLADDEPAVLDIAQRTLEAIGYKVITATNGEEAIQKYVEHQEEIVGAVLDLMMPVMDGEGATNGIRELNANLPIVIVTGMQSTESFNRLSTRTRLKVLNKPYQVKDLEQALNKLGV